MTNETYRSGEILLIHSTNISAFDRNKKNCFGFLIRKDSIIVIKFLNINYAYFLSIYGNKINTFFSILFYLFRN